MCVRDGDIHPSFSSSSPSTRMTFSKTKEEATGGKEDTHGRWGIVSSKKRGRPPREVEGILDGCLSRTRVSSEVTSSRSLLAHVFLL